MEEKKVVKQNAPEINLRSCLDFEVEKEGRRYSFHMPMGAPLGEAFDAVFSVLEKVRELQAGAVTKAAENAELAAAEEEKGK